MACFTPVNIATQTRDLLSLLMVNKALRKWAIRALGGKLLPINYITTEPCPQTHRRKVLRQGLVPFNPKTSLFCVTSLSQNFELWFRSCGSAEPNAPCYPWTREHVISYLKGFEELEPLVKNLVFPVQKDRWKFSTLYQQHWTKLIGPAGGALPIMFAQRFPHLEKIGMINERKVWHDREVRAPKEFCLVKTVNRSEISLAGIPHICFTLWIEWWAWDARIRLAVDPTQDLEAAICQLLGRSKPPRNDLSDGS